MKKNITIGLMMLSFYLCNTHSSIAVYDLVTKNTQITLVASTDLKVTADILSRDDQTTDCLRKRKCSS